MKYSVTLFLLACSFFAKAQTDTIDINNYLSLHLDSIEKRTHVKRKYQTTSYLLHYRIKNMTDDTVMIITNSCPSYNQYALLIKDSLYQLNNCFCSYNATKKHKISPQQSFQRHEYILDQLVIDTSGNVKVGFCIPFTSNQYDSIHFINPFKEVFGDSIKSDSIIKFRIYSHSSLLLSYYGEAKLIKTIYRRKKKIKRQKTNSINN